MPKDEEIEGMVNVVGEVGVGGLRERERAGHQSELKRTCSDCPCGLVGILAYRHFLIVYIGC